MDTVTAKTMIEEKLNELEIEINNSKEQRQKIEITKDDIKAFIEYAKNLMEHPGEMLNDSKNINEKRTLFEFVFDGVPTYQEIVSETPKLSLPFEVSSNPDKAESLSAHDRVFSWNYIEEFIKQWKYTYSN